MRKPSADEAALGRYLDTVAPHYDAVLMQPVASGLEYRIFLLDDEVVYSVRKFPPSLEGDGRHRVRDLLIAHNAALEDRGLSAIDPAAIPQAELDRILPAGERRKFPAG